MARLAVSIAGAVIGSFFGMPQLGWMAGAVIGSLLFPPKGTTSEGPRLGDATVTSSAEGSPRGPAFGTMRRAGQLLWIQYFDVDGSQKPFREQRTETKSGGKGMAPSNTSITYEYYSTFMLGFGEGPAVDLLRMWSDGKLIYDRTGDGEFIEKEGLSFTVHLGTATEEQDPVMVAALGADRTPAYRNEVTVVFDDLKMSDYGNRPVPNITAEFVYETPNDQSRALQSTRPGDFDALVPAARVAPDWARGLNYGVSNGSPSYFRRVDLNSMVETREAVTSTLTAAGDIPNEHATVLPSGKLIASLGVDNTNPVAVFDGTSWVEWGRTPIEYQTIQQWSVANTQGGQYREFGVGVSNAIGNYGMVWVFAVDQEAPHVRFVWEASDAVPNWSDLSWGTLTFTCTDTAFSKGGEDFRFLIASASTGSDRIYIRRVTVNHYAGHIPTNIIMEYPGTDFEDLGAVLAPDVDPTKTTFDALHSVGFDPVDGTLLLLATLNGGIERLFKVDLETLEVLWVVPCTSLLDLTHSNIRNSTIGWVNNDRGYMADIRTGQMIVDGYYFGAGSTLSGRYGAWNSTSQSYVMSGSEPSATYKFLLNRAGPTGTTVGAVARAICARVDLPAEDLDTTDIDGDVLPGYLLGSVMNARQALQPLCDIFNCDVVESDFKLVFRKRGGSSVRTIPQSQMLRAKQDKAGGVPSPLKTDRIQDVDLPQRFTVAYLDVDNDYAQGAQTRKRTLKPLPVMYARSALSVGASIGLTAEIAKQAADRLLQAAWSQRVGMTTGTAWRHCDIEPTDVVTFQLDSGLQAEVFLSEVATGVDRTTELRGMSEEEAQYVSAVLGAASRGTIQQVIPSNAPTNLVMWDGPLLRNQDENPSRGGGPIYFGGAPYTENAFRSSTLYRTMDGEEFTALARLTMPLGYGTVTGAPVTPISPFMTDEVSQLRVYMVDGAERLETVTDAQMLDGANPFVLIKSNGEVEYMAYREVTSEGSGFYLLTGLLRGLRGTDTMCAGHAVGDQFVLLEPGPVQEFDVSLDDVGVEANYRAVPDGKTQIGTPGVGLTPIIRALMPYAPADVRAELGVSDEVTISWSRCDRLGVDMKDGQDDQPLSEDAELYSLDIYDGPTIVRNESVAAAEEWEYSAAAQTTDGFTPPLAQITVMVRQVSGQVGPGFGRLTTIDLV